MTGYIRGRGSVEPARVPAKTLRFGLFEVDLTAGELRKRGRRVPLQDQPFQVLAVLLRRPGEIVAREELQKALWPADTFVEFDESLSKAVQKLRRALGDSAGNPRFIETLPRKGYRFIAPVNGPAAPAPATSRRPFLLRAALALSLIVAAGAAGWIMSNRLSAQAAGPEQMRCVSDTGDQGIQAQGGRDRHDVLFSN